MKKHMNAGTLGWYGSVLVQGEERGQWLSCCGTIVVGSLPDDSLEPTDLSPGPPQEIGGVRWECVTLADGMRRMTQRAEAACR